MALWPSSSDNFMLALDSLMKSSQIMAPSFLQTLLGNLVILDKTQVIVKGPSLLRANLGSMMFHLRFLVLSQTLSLTLNGVNQDLIQLFMSCWMSLWAARASFLALLRVLRCSSTTGRWEFTMTLGIAWVHTPT